MNDARGWRVGFDDGSGPDYILDDAGKPVARLRWGCGCCEDRRELSPAECERARLIAAAPDSHAVNVALLAWDRWRWEGSTENARLLREAVTAIGYTGALAASMGGIVDAARAAIAKAEGK
jgi:hypothetical protein